MHAMADDTHTTSGWRSVLKGNVLMLGLVSCFTDMSSEMIYPLLPVFISGLVAAGMAPVYIGLMDGIADSVSSLLKIYAGRLSDLTRRRKRFVLIGYGISSLCRPLMGAASGGLQVIALRFLDRVGKGIRTAPRDALIGDSVSPDIRGRAFSFHRAMDHLGAVTGPLIALAMLHAFLGYALWQGGAPAASPAEMRALRWLFVLSLLPGVLAVLAIAVGVSDVPTPTASAARPAPPAPSGAAPAERFPRRFYAFLAAVALFALGNSSDLFLVFYAKTQFLLGTGKVIGLWVLLHVAKTVFSIPGGSMADRVGRRPAILIGWLFYAAVYLAAPRLAAEWQFWALLAVYGAYYGMTEGAEKALVTDIVPPALRGRAFGWYHGAVGIAALPASLLFGVFWKALGPTIAFSAGAALAGAAAVVLAALGSAPHARTEFQG